MKRRVIPLRVAIPILLVALLIFLPSVAGAHAGSVGPGLYETTLLTNKGEEMGTVRVWNSPKKLMVKVEPIDGWAIKQVMVYVGYPQLNPIPSANNGNPLPGKFPYVEAFKYPTIMHQLTLDLKEDLGFSWGATSSEYRYPTISVHAQIKYMDGQGNSGAQQRVWAYGPDTYDGTKFGWTFDYQLAHPMRGHFVDAPVAGLGFYTGSNSGLTDGSGSFDYFPGERVDLWVGNVYLGQAETAKKISPLDLFMADVEDPRVTNVARLLQSMDADGNPQGGIDIRPSVAGCLNTAAANLAVDPAGVNWADDALIDALIAETIEMCLGNPEASLVAVSAEQAQANLTDGISASGIYRKNISKTAEWGESNQQIEVMPVYFPGFRSNGDPSLCVDVDGDREYDEGVDTMGVPYQEYRLGGDPAAEECDPRNFEDEDACQITLIECRDIAKPLIVSYLGEVDIFDDSVTTEFASNRFAHDLYVAISRDDGATWKRMNVSRMADLSSFDLETGEHFPGTVRSPQMKVNDNHVLAVWTSTYARGGNPRYAITLCDDPDTPEVETPETGCQIICKGDDEDPQECAPDYPYDDAYYVDDIWGVRGQQGSVNYDEVDDVADLGIGEIPYSALWAARGVIVTQADIESGRFASMTRLDDPETEEDESEAVEVGDIVWFKPERITSGRRDAFIPMVSNSRGSGFAIAWQEDPDGLRPGKGKGPGEGWSGAISNHKTDIWYTYITQQDFAVVDENFVPGGPPEDGGPDEKPGLGRPKAQVPFALPVRISDNDMVNTDTLKVTLDAGTGLPVIDAATGTYTPIDPLLVEHGNAVGTKRYAYLAKESPLYAYYADKLDLCATTDSYGDIDGVILDMPGTAEHERWFRFTNTEGSEKTVCISSDGRLLDGDVSASRPNIQLQTYTRSDGTKSAWVLLAYEESKGMGHSLAASEHDGEELTPGDGQEKPVKQDFGKNVIYHSFDFTQPDLVSAGHIVNLPALCGGLYPNYCDDPDNPTCSCVAGQPIPLYFDRYVDNGDGTGEWMPQEDLFLQFRTEIARRARFFSQAPGKVGPSGTVANIIFKQGQEGQGRPADVFIRRIVNQGGGNPYRFENFECTTYLDETFDLPSCPNGAGDMPSDTGYMCNVWGQASGDRLCGGIFNDPVGGYERRDQVNLTSADIDLAVDAGPEDDTPDDPTDDVYGTDKVLLWSQHDYNLGDESYGVENTDVCDEISCAGMYSNARSHRGFIRGDFVVAAYAWSPNWAAARNGNDRYNFYLRKSFDGGQTWTTTPAELGGDGVYYCREWRSDPTVPDEDGSGNAPPVYEGFDAECVSWCPPCEEGGVCECAITGEYIAAGAFQPAVKVSEFDNNKETSSDPRVGATPPVYPLDGRVASLPFLRLVEDEYVDNIFFVAWGAGENVKSTGGQSITPEAAPTDAYYTRSIDWGDTFLKVPWVVNGENSNYAGQTVWRYQRLAWGDPEQGECQIKATSDGSKMYAIYHEMIPVEGDPDEPITRGYPWEPEESHDNDVWFRRIIFWPEDLQPQSLPGIQAAAVPWSPKVYGPMVPQGFVPTISTGDVQSLQARSQAVQLSAAAEIEASSVPVDVDLNFSTLLPALVQD